MAMSGKKIKVKITESFVILADPRPKDVLDAKYAGIKADFLKRERPPSPATIQATIDTLKKRDRYGEPIYGFPRDRAFRPDEECMLDADLAKLWEEDQKCVILESSTKAA